MVSSRKYVFKNDFQGISKRFYYEIAEYQLTSLRNSPRKSPKSYTHFGLIVLMIFVFLNSVQSTTSSSVNTVKARKYVVKNNFQGVPKKSDFEIVEEVLPPLKNGEILLKAEWISVDPYLRFYNRNVAVPYDQFSFQIGIVEESMNANYSIGTRVVTHKGWSDYSVLNANILKISLVFPRIEFIWKLPDLQGLSPSLGIGAVGVPGISAYFGLLEICQPKEGETVVITGAAGAIGSVVGQIAKIKGCKVIGFTGSKDKVQWLEKELGFDTAINYKTADIQKALQAAAPNGVDCYFDNVGGEISSIIISQMNVKGRVAVCGSVSAYNINSTQLPKATILQPDIFLKELKIEGFLVTRWTNRWSEAIAQLITWIQSGQLKPAEHVTVGFDKIFDAFVGMLAGENRGKALVKV